MDIIEKVLNRDEFKKNPPVLLDIGASGQIYKHWKRIAPHAVCIAFDADLREVKYIEDGSSGYKRIYLINKILTAEGSGNEKDFYLTKSPFCSSLLEPDLESLRDWSIVDLFEIEKKISLKTTTLPAVLAELKIERIDWFKTDSQGTDLRLFRSLGDNIIDKILVADFEPGVIDAYKGEDKLHSLMAYMDGKPFWVNELVVPGTQRIDKEIKENILFKDLAPEGRNRLNLIIKSAPMCGEISYLNDFKNLDIFDKRDYLLMWVISFLKGHLGFALEIAVKGMEQYNDEIFSELKDEVLGVLNRRIKMVKYKMPYYKLRRWLKF